MVGSFQTLLRECFAIRMGLVMNNWQIGPHLFANRVAKHWAQRPFANHSPTINKYALTSMSSQITPARSPSRPFTKKVLKVDHANKHTAHEHISDGKNSLRHDRKSATCMADQSATSCTVPALRSQACWHTAKASGRHVTLCQRTATNADN